VESCDVLIGADGIKSRVRAQLRAAAGEPGPEKLRYSGTVCWRGRLPLSAFEQGAEWVKQVRVEACGREWMVCGPVRAVDVAR
jgi:2-polyprenyl-6-methoxyphenol hydroxylase-like FAD-dependent oxidoreductase